MLFAQPLRAMTPRLFANPRNLPCEYRDWDSTFFGFRVAQVNSQRLTAAGVHATLEWCAQERIDCLYLLVDAADVPAVRLAEEYQFKFVDVRMTFTRCLEWGRPLPRLDAPPGCTMRSWREADLPALRAIARVSHRSSRFYADANFPVERVSALYETWIEASCHGDADHVLVAEHEHRPVGYSALHLDQDGKGRIGILGVSEESRQKGIGCRLVNEALLWLTERDVREVSVVTQGRNCEAQRLYQRCGFLSHSVQCWYHRWFPR